MPTDDKALSLWFDNDFDDKPHRVSSRDELLVVETETIEWPAIGICAPFEIVLAHWGDKRQIFSTAFARPMNGNDWPYVSLGHHKSDGPRQWKGGGRDYNDERSLSRHLRRAAPILLRRGLWGRALWLDRELNLARQDEGVMRLYLGASGKGQWFLPSLSNFYNLSAEFSWSWEDASSLLLDSSDEELLQWVYARAEDLESDLSFALNWAAWGRTPHANEKRVALNFRFARGSMDELRELLELTAQCEPEFAYSKHLRWEINPLTAPDYACANVHADEKRGAESLSDDNGPRTLAPFTRRIREWAHHWFGVELDHELRARHRCIGNFREPLTLVIKRPNSPTAHEQIEAFAQLRDFLATRVSPDELKSLLMLS